MKTLVMPQAVRATLWSYDTDKIDFSLPDHRRRVIENVLNRGTTEAIDWLLLNFKNYEIADVIKHSPKQSWNKKSLALWSLVFGVEPIRTSRFA